MQILKVLREKRGLSQAKLAARSDMNPATVWRIETGQRSPTVKQLERLAAAMDLEIADFFPKIQVPLQLEEGKPTAGRIVADTMAVTAGKWLEELDDEWEEPEFNRWVTIGKLQAIVDITNVMAEGRTEDWLDSLDPGEKEDLIAVTSVLGKVGSRITKKMREEREANERETENASNELARLEEADERPE